MWIRTARHHFSLDKVTFTDILKDNDLLVSFVDGSDILLQGEEAKQVLDYLDNISCPSWGLDEITEEYKES